MTEKASEMSDKFGRTALARAASRGALRTVEKLVNNGANIHTRDLHSSTLLHHAAHCGRVKVALFLLDKDRTLINATDSYGNTPLHKAALFGHTNAVRLLLEKGANIDSQNKGQETPLHLAGFTGDKKTYDLLLKEGAKTDIFDGDGRPPHLLAKNYSHCAILSRWGQL
jgi:ankyrin repeat protein